MSIYCYRLKIRKFKTIFIKENLPRISLTQESIKTLFSLNNRMLNVNWFSLKPICYK